MRLKLIKKKKRQGFTPDVDVAGGGKIWGVWNLDMRKALEIVFVSFPCDLVLKRSLSNFICL